MSQVSSQYHWIKTGRGHQMSDVNPYQSPEIIEEASIENSAAKSFPPSGYASRWLRLGGAILDSFIVGIPALTAAYLLGLYGSAFFEGRDMDVEAQIIALLIGISFFLSINGVLIYTRGQTLGKVICGTVVVTKDFQQVSGNRYLFLRTLPFWIIEQMPVLGEFFSLADALAIFRPEKNCLHDDIAGTRVIMKRDLDVLSR